ncbi:hypothetical protein H4V97_002447 [Flavobacterium sp. CG_23.5]|uniref:hypothetical protein n=1 Tax=unclassified Flavobacterium TaxID=196869 RepID=UPI0018CA5C53|nr:MULTISPECIES: hypothetical protein [unclassified Flavobacterium]MBG6110444.1 hypothetical protein [Flavobacterium sp. CG_9.10]MBP2284129.1 hypothetical protein [Flavobacterium sp. CG_23.5]
MTDITINIKTGSDNSEPKVTTTDSDLVAVPKTEFPTAESPKVQTPKKDTKEKTSTDKESPKKAASKKMDMTEEEHAKMGSKK